VIVTRSGTSTTGTYDYTAFGNLQAQTGTDICRFKFSSKERDVSTGFSYYGYRFYAPQWQRWVNVDPITERGGLNLYSFVHNDPVGRVDPLGHVEYDPYCYAKCGKQWTMENALCFGATVLGGAACIIFPAACIPAGVAVLACFTAAQLHYTACVASCVINRKCPYPIGPYPGGFMDFP
jgi:RHS repeat-associated protein